MEKWKKTTLNFIRRVSKSIIKCCSVEFPWSSVYYKFFCLPKQFFYFLFFFGRSVHFFLKNIRETRKEIGVAQVYLKYFQEPWDTDTKC